MTFDDESERDRERSAALEAWVAAFDREMVQGGDFAATVAAMAAHGCFDLRAVVERWTVANPSGDVAASRPQLLPQESAPQQLAFQQGPVLEQARVLEEAPVLEAVAVLQEAAVLQEVPMLQEVPALEDARALQPVLVLEQGTACEEAPALPGPALDDEPTEQKSVDGFSPEIAHFHSLLQGGIDRAQIYEAFPAFRLVIDEAVVQYEAAAPILSEDPANPSREHLDDEMRRVRQDLVDSGKRPRRRWRSRS